MNKTELGNYLEREVKEILGENEKGTVYVYDVTDYRLTKKETEGIDVGEEWMVEDFYVFEDFKGIVDFEFVVTSEKINEHPLYEMELV